MQRGKYQWGKGSQRKLEVLDPGMHLAMDLTLHMGLMDLTVAYTFRDEAAQNEAFRKGNSQKRWPDSIHNVVNEAGYVEAIDVYPFLNGAACYNANQCAVMVGGIMLCGAMIGVSMTSGINWDRDGEWVTDHTLKDFGHVQKLKDSTAQDQTRKMAVEAMKRQSLVHEYLLDMIDEGKGAQDPLFFEKIREEMEAIYGRNRAFFGGLRK